jgi:hypothetical protein
MIPAIRNGADKIFDLVDALADLVFNIQNPTAWATGTSKNEQALADSVKTAIKFMPTTNEAQRDAKLFMMDLQEMVSAYKSETQDVLGDKQLQELIKIVDQLTRGVELSEEQMNIASSSRKLLSKQARQAYQQKRSESYSYEIEGYGTVYGM